MKKLIVLIASMLVFSSITFSQTKAGKTDTIQHPSFYYCAMHPEIVSGEPGDCPVCGMELLLSSKERMKTDATKNYNCPIILYVTKHDPSQCPQCGRPRSLSSKEQMKAEVMKLYTCPMHPNTSLDKNGICQNCKALKEKKST